MLASLRRPALRAVEPSHLAGPVLRAAVVLLSAMLLLFSSPVSLASAAGHGQLTVPAGKVALKKVGAKRLTALAELEFTVPKKLPASFGIQFRSKGKAQGYRAVIEVAQDGSVSASFARVLKSKATLLGSRQPLGILVSPGEKLRIEGTVAAKSEVRMYLRTWIAGTAKPSAWQLKRTDSSAQRIKTKGTVYAWASSPIRASVSYKKFKVKGYSLAKAEAVGVRPPATASALPPTPSPAATSAPVQTPSAVAAAKPSTPAPSTPAPSASAKSPSPSPTKSTAAPSPAAPVLTATASTANSAGVPKGASLQKVTGDIRIREPGTVLSNLDIHGYVSVEADNVTIKTSIIRGGDAAKTNRALVMAWWGARNLKIVDSTLFAKNPSLHVDGISGSGFTAERVNVYGVVDGIKVIGSNVTVKDSWLHSPIHSDNDPNQKDGKTHDDGIQVVGGTGIQIERNLIEGFHNAAIMVKQDQSVVKTLVVKGNKLTGGGCTVNMSQGGSGGKSAPLQGVSIKDNQFGPGRYGTTCPMRLPAASNIGLSGNTWLHSGKSAVPLRS